jgi:5-carboxymethyl-2-hydroxymuconate isomerase
MPHFVIECSENVLKIQSAEKIITDVHNTAKSTNLFKQGDIKVRIKTYNMFTVGGTQNDFIHVFGYIMQGRNEQQKIDLSQRIIKKLKELFPDVPVISMNVMDFEKATYCNRNMI